MPNKSYYTGACKGNGMTLGLTDGTKNYGIYENQEAQLQTATDYWNKSIGTGTSSGVGDWSNKVFGITTDSSISGIIVESDTNVKMIIKY